MSILVIHFCNNVFSVKRLLWQSTGTLNCQFMLFLIISFSTFQYFNLHFGSLKLCFTNLVLEIQDNLSLIFLSSLEISNLFFFLLIFGYPPSLWVISQNSSPGLSDMPKSNSIQNNQIMILWPLFGSLDWESWMVWWFNEAVIRGIH